MLHRVGVLLACVLIKLVDPGLDGGLCDESEGWCAAGQFRCMMFGECLGGMFTGNVYTAGSSDSHKYCGNLHRTAHVVAV